MKKKEIVLHCDFCAGKQNEHGFYIERKYLFYEDSIYGIEGIEIEFCPICGSRIEWVEQDGEGL